MFYKDGNRFNSNNLMFLVCDEVSNQELLIKQIKNCFNDEVIVKRVSRDSFYRSLFCSDIDLVCVVLRECEFCYEDFLILKDHVSSSEHIAFSFFGREDRFFDLIEDKIECDMLLIDVSLLGLVWSNKEMKIKGLSTRDAVYRMVAESNQYGLQAYIAKNRKEKVAEVPESNGRILLWMDGIPSFPNGTSIHAMGMLEGLCSQKESLPQIDVCINQETADYYDIKNKYGVRVVDKEQLCDTYEVVFLAVFICSLEVLDIIDQHAQKWCAWILDSIDLRCFNNTYQLNRTRFFSEFADGLVFTSDDAYQDFSHYVTDLDKTTELERAVVSIPATIRRQDSENVTANNNIPLTDYVLIVGNRYKHKMIEETIDAVKDIDDKFLVLGASKNGFVRDNVYGLVSGSLSDEELIKVYNDSSMVIFPSIYEGFGLPIVDAINCGKSVIVVERQLNHELEELGDYEERFYYYKNYNEIERIIKEIRRNNNSDSSIYSRTWKDVGIELKELIERVYKKKTDIQRLIRRHSYFKLYDRNEVSRNNILKQIASFDEERINCDKVIDIYGKGLNSLVFAKKIKEKCIIGKIVDKNTVGKTKVDEFDLISPDDYNYNEEHIVVIVPDQFISEIKKELIIRDARFKRIIVSLEEFIINYIA